jgi:hypothetical protein
MAEELWNLSISGVYSLLILSLSFNFLLAIRIKQLQDRFASYQENTTRNMGILTERLESLVSAAEKATSESEGK